jgi:hypothetical protein
MRSVHLLLSGRLSRKRRSQWAGKSAHMSVLDIEKNGKNKLKSWSRMYSRVWLVRGEVSNAKPIHDCACPCE